MNLRLSRSAKALLTEAARLAGLSLSEYVLRHSMEAAHAELVKARYSALSQSDTKQLIETLGDASQAPSEGLLRAAETYKKRVAAVRE
jgi:uncharacterized protein (DUF1778 family)